MKAVHFLIALLFLYAAAVQFNDPDPLYWVVVYAGTAAIAIAKGFQRFNKFWTAVAVGGVVAGLLVSAPGFVNYLGAGDFGILFEDMHVAASVEPAREFLGLALSLIVLVCYVRQSSR